MVLQPVALACARLLLLPSSHHCCCLSPLPLLGSRVTPGVFLHLLQLVLALSSSLDPALKPITSPGSGQGQGAEPALLWVMRRAPALAPQLPHLPPSLLLTLALFLALAWGCPLLPRAWATWCLERLLIAGYCAEIKPVCTFIVVLPVSSSPGAAAQTQGRVCRCPPQG